MASWFVSLFQYHGDTGGFLAKILFPDVYYEDIMIDYPLPIFLDGPLEVLDW